MIESAKLEPFPSLAFIWMWLGFGITFWSPIGMLMAGLLGLAFGAAAALLSRHSQLVFEPSDAPVVEKRRFLRRTAISQIAFTALVIPAAAYFLPRVTSFFFPATWVMREPAILYYLGGFFAVFAIAAFNLSRKFA